MKFGDVPYSCRSVFALRVDPVATEAGCPMHARDFGEWGDEYRIYNVVV